MGRRRVYPTLDLFGGVKGEAREARACGKCGQCGRDLVDWYWGDGARRRGCPVCGLELELRGDSGWVLVSAGVHRRCGSVMCCAGAHEGAATRECGRCGYTCTDEYGGV